MDRRLDKFPLQPRSLKSVNVFPVFFLQQPRQPREHQQEQHHPDSEAVALELRRLTHVSRGKPRYHARRYRTPRRSSVPVQPAQNGRKPARSWSCRPRRASPRSCRQASSSPRAPISTCGIAVAGSCRLFAPVWPRRIYVEGLEEPIYVISATRPGHQRQIGRRLSEPHFGIRRRHRGQDVVRWTCHRPEPGICPTAQAECPGPAPIREYRSYFSEWHPRQ